MEEIWKDVLGYEGIYQISSLGRLKTLKWGNQKIINGSLSSSGYITAKLFKDGYYKNKTIHQLVAIAFLNHKPEGYNIIVDHINNNPLDNRLENLQLTSCRHNTSKDKTNKTSKYSGVSWSKSNKKWYSSVTINKKTFNLGHYNKEIDAYKAYKNKLKQLNP